MSQKKKTSVTLLVDTIIQYAMGILCILYPFVIEPIGVPIFEPPFYPTILDAVLFGISITLTIEYYRKNGGMVDLVFT